LNAGFIRPIDWNIEMDDYEVDYVKYFSQEEETTCWEAAYKMMLYYKNKAESNVLFLPNREKMRERGILDSEFVRCRNNLGLCSSSFTGFLSREDIRSKLIMYGPIWVCGRYCASKYKHIVVLIGVRGSDDSSAQVCINDPWSAYCGGAPKERWIPFKSFTGNINRVPFSCQHWL
jgi:hypothetical protein